MYKTPWFHYLRYGVLAALLAVVAAGLSLPAQGQGRTCRDAGNLTVCADIMNENADGFVAEFNVTIAPKNGDPVVLVTDRGEVEDRGYVAAAFFHFDEPHHQYGTADFVEGQLHFFNDLTVTTLASSARLIDDQRVEPGIFYVDTIQQRIYNPAPGAVPLFKEKGIPHNGNVDFAFLDRTGMKKLFKDGGTVEELKDVNVEIDIKTKKFTATIPTNLRLNDHAETPNLRLITRVTIDEQGKFSGAVDGFKVRLAGLLFDAQKVTIQPGSEEKSASFEAGIIDVRKSDNPGMPNLDPAHPDLVFRLEKLRYKDGAWDLGGGSVPLPDWTVGDAFSLRQQSAGLTFDNQSKTYTVNISTTIMSGGQDAPLGIGQRFPVALRLGARQVNGQFQPFMSTKLASVNIPLHLSSMILQPEELTMVMDPAGNFFGLTAERVRLQWINIYGGQQSGAITGFKLGIDNQRDLVFGLQGGAIDLPELKNKAFTGKLQGGIGVQNGVVTLTMNGKLALNLPGNAGLTTDATFIMRGGRNVRTICPSGATNCLDNEEFKMSSFGVKIAGFTFQLDNPRGFAGGFAVDKAKMSVPVGVKAVGAEVAGFSVSGNGDVNIAGGGIELPPISMAGYQFVGLKGYFAKTPAGGYEFKAAGIMPLPGMDPSGNKRINVDLSFRTNAAGSFQGLGVGVTFRTTSPGIPIGATGMELLEMGGKFDLNSGTAKVTVSLVASSKYRIANMPLVTARGNASLQVRPFAMTANAQLSVLVFNVANASIGLGDRQGFNGGAGFNVSFTVDAVVVHGGAKLRMGNVTLTNGAKKFRWTAEAFLAVGLRKGQFGPFLPPKSINVGSVAFRGGSFRAPDGREVAGLQGQAKCCFFVKVTLFYDFGKKSVILRGAGDYKLIDAAQVRALAAQQMAGFRSAAMSAEEIAAAGLVLPADADLSNIIQETIPVEVKQMGTTLFGIDYPAGEPSLRLQLPTGEILTEQMVDNVTSTFLRETGTLTETHQLAFILQDAVPGLYTLIIDNAPAEYAKVSYTLNNEPVVTDVTAQCSDIDMTDDIIVTCDGARAGSAVTLSWHAGDSDNPDAKVSVGYAPVAEDGVTLDLTGLRTLVEELSLGAGTYGWDLTEVPTGRYKLVVTVEDEENPAVQVAADPVIDVLDRRPPQTPDLFDGESTPLPAGQLLGWLPNQELDLAGYEIGMGLEFDPAQFIYTRTLGIKEVVTATGLIDAKLWGLDDDREVWVGVRAYDESGNYSEWSDLLGVKPWAVSPRSWTPVPGSTVGTKTEIAVAFHSSLKPESVGSALELFDANGAPLPGTMSLLKNLDATEVIGMRFDPAVPLEDGQSYTVRVRGGSDGISTLDGRMMPDHYTWQFTVDASLDLQDEPLAGLTIEHDGPRRVGEAVNFTANVTEGGNVRYTWDFGDGATADGASVSHAYAEAGSYLVRVTASNSLGQLSTETLVQVEPSVQLPSVQVFLPAIMR
ncbi:MAG: hypothetical protein DCC55_25225 [Chloroflexi bacterium]|nr:MAG: hypothetical protein DCC55_25225 [Chloroflexota bacterium]